MRNMWRQLNYEKVFNTLVQETTKYCRINNIKSLVLGISGGIDSTVVAAIAREVCDNLNIPLIGRSLPIKNSNDEFHTSEFVGKVFCDDFKVVNLYEVFIKVCDAVEEDNHFEQTSIANGNIQARLRMLHLYNLASINNGMVLSTDNQTEYQLGFWTIHGDVGDFDPIQALWKTEVYELADWLVDYYFAIAEHCATEDEAEPYGSRVFALNKSIKLTPTDGLGISNSDLDQIGAKSYKDVDTILQMLLTPKNTTEHIALNNVYYNKYGKEAISKIWERHRKSEFKRLKSPISVDRSKLY